MKALVGSNGGTEVKGQGDLKWRLRESGLAEFGLVEYDPVE